MIRSGSWIARRATRSAAPRISATSASTGAASDQPATAPRRRVDGAPSDASPVGRTTSSSAERSARVRVARAFLRLTTSPSRVSSVALGRPPTAVRATRGAAGDAATSRVASRDERAALDAGTVRCLRAGERSMRDRDAVRWFDTAPTDAPLLAERPGSAALASGEATAKLPGAWATGAAGSGSTGAGAGAGAGVGAGAGAGVGAGLGAGCAATGGGGVAGEGGRVAGGAAGAGGGLEALRGGSKPSGSTYLSPSPTRIPRWTYGVSCSASPE